VARAIALAIAPLLLASAQPVVDDAVTELHHLQALDQRVASIGYRLAIAGTCAAPVPLAGIGLRDLTLYGGDGREAARRAFGLDDAPQLNAVAAASPAARAGLAAGDALLAIGGVAVPAPDAATGYDRIERLDTAIEGEASDGILDLTVRHDGVSRTVRVPLERGCASRFIVRVADDTQAEADGRYVAITSAYVEQAADDPALAIVLAHELAHNILGHRARLEREGVRYGVAQHFGRNARLIRQTEIEADRVGLDILIRAGFDARAAIAFRERQWRGIAYTVLRSPTHPPSKERLALLRAEYDRVVRAALGAD